MFPRGLLILALPAIAAAQFPLPNITLPWGTWQATGYNADTDFYTWTNIRYGKAPLDDLRFRASVPPDPIKNPLTPQDSSYGPVCIQVDTSAPCTPGGLTALPPVVGQQNEDCLFLDLYVPRLVFEGKVEPAPVVVWIFGGAYVYGGKNAFGPSIPFYNGTGLLQTAQANGNQNVIFVAGNYRVGAYGWLAGTTMEAQGTPNAGLTDQRLLFEWVQKYISQVGGDKTRVTAWGESAGAGSILHHLLADGGQRDPLFSKALLESPAFQWQWNRTGTLEDTFRTFTALAGCPRGDIKCLRTRNNATLAAANQRLFVEGTVCTGIFDVGPSLDGKLIRELPYVAFSKGNYYKNLDSFIVSHVADEASTFTPPNVKTWADFNAFIAKIFDGPKFASIRDAIDKQYYGSFFEGGVCWGELERVSPAVCLSYVIRDAFFVCNTRLLYDAYSPFARMYMMQYYFFNDFGGAQHGDDLIPTFWNQYWDLEDFLYKYANLSGISLEIATHELSELAPAYQSYFVSHATTGDPNTHAGKRTVEWPVAHEDGDYLYDVLYVRYGLIDDFDTDYDDLNRASRCGFWSNIQIKIQAMLPKEEEEEEDDDDPEFLFVQQQQPQNMDQAEL